MGSKSMPMTTPFALTLRMRKGKSPLGAVIEACEKITCRCFGDPDSESRKIIDGFGTTYHNTAPNAFALNPRADKDSPV